MAGSDWSTFRKNTSKVSTSEEYSYTRRITKGQCGCENRRRWRRNCRHLLLTAAEEALNVAVRGNIVLWAKLLSQLCRPVDANPEQSEAKHNNEDADFGL